METRKKVITAFLLVIGILVLVNILSDRFFLRLDFTEDQRYSLSDATKDILKNLDEPVTVTAYFSKNLPPDVARVREDFKDLLIEYNSYSDGQVVYDFVNPNESQDLEMKAQQSGVQPIMINVRERDQMKQQRAYLGAVVQKGEKKEIIPFIQPGAAMEFALSSNIKKLSVDKKPKIGILEGNGEPGLSQMQQVNEQLSILYDVQTVKLNDKTSIPADIKTLVIVAPKDTLPNIDFNYFDEFLSKGGRILFAVNTVDGNLSKGMGEKVYTGLSNYLGKKGIYVSDNLVIDAKCANVMVRQQQGMFVMNTPVSFPYLPVISKFADSPITKGLESVIMPFASDINVTSKDSSIKFTTLAFTSDKSGVQTVPIYFDVSKNWTAQDFNMSELPVAVSAEGKLVGNQNSKIVVFGDGDFAVNGAGEQQRKLQPDNVSLLVNAVDWLSDDTGLVELRTKGVTSRPLKAQLEDGTKTLIKYLNFLLPIILIIAYGIIRFQIKRKVRNSLMSVDYV